MTHTVWDFKRYFAVCTRDEHVSELGSTDRYSIERQAVVLSIGRIQSKLSSRVPWRLQEHRIAFPDGKNSGDPQITISPGWVCIVEIKRLGTVIFTFHLLMFSLPKAERSFQRTHDAGNN